MHTAYLGLGSNLGDRLAALRSTVSMLRDHLELRRDGDLVAASLYETEPQDVPDAQPRYFNSAVQVLTSRSPRELLHVIQAIEAALGRTRGLWGAARSIDIDLLLFDEQVVDTAELTVPHPRLHQRRFVLKPLKEIAGSVLHPTAKVPISNLASRLGEPPDRQAVLRIMSAAWIGTSAPLEARFNLAHHPNGSMRNPRVSSA